MRFHKNLNTKNLVLKPFTESMISNKYIEWLNDKEIMQFSEQRFKLHTLDTCLSYFLSFDFKNNGLWSINHKDSEDHIGNINIYYDQFNNRAEVGILIGDKKYSGQGYGFECFNEMIKFLLEDCNVYKITAGTMSVNIPMLKIMDKCKMSDDGVFKNHFFHQGKYVDLVHKAVFNKEFGL